MLLSIIGNILGEDDDGSSGDSGNDDLIGGDLSGTGSTSDQGLMPDAGGGTASGTDDSDAGGMDMGGDDFLDDDGGDDFLEDEGLGGGDEMSLDEVEDDGGVSSELEARIEEMENDVGSLSSTVNTVQSENEKISDSLEEIEEDIRKLLEVYEMVTQGVNPFVEGDSLSESFDGGGGGGMAAGTGEFGGQSLFDGGDEGGGDEDMDEDIADAEAEEFLDESIIEDDDGGDDFDDVGMDDGFDDAEDDLGGDDLGGDLGTDDGADDVGGSDGDLSFDELKSEYESGEADWDENPDADDAEADSTEIDGAADETADVEMDAANGDDDDLEFDEFDEGAEETSPGDELEEAGIGVAEESDDSELEAELGIGASEEDDTTEAEPDQDGDAVLDDSASETDTDSELESEGDAVDETIPWDDGGRPYLAEIPSEYNTEYVVMDWLEYLVEQAGLNGAAQTLRFYETIGWISASVEDYLQTMLNGFEGGPDLEDPEPRSSLGVDHKRSLWRISQIATPAKKRRSFDEWLADEGISTRRTIEVEEPGETAAEADEDTDHEADVSGPADDDLEQSLEAELEIEDEAEDEDDEGEDDAEEAGEADDERTELTYTEVEPADDAESGGEDVESHETDEITEKFAAEDVIVDEDTVDVPVAAAGDAGGTAVDDGPEVGEVSPEELVAETEPDDEDDVGLEGSTGSGSETETETETETENGTVAETQTVAEPASETGTENGNGNGNGNDLGERWEEASEEDESNTAQRIVIDESGIAETETTERERDRDHDPGGMVWADPEVVQTESGTEIRDDYYGYTDPDDRGKPVLVPDESADLEPWQVEFINSILISDETDYE
ncbi:Flagella accessory protein C (FlaC) [Halobiforma haloterrestris]|uniref:Flagella accessory protein C (FlaC) n=1 Tax=Natronobacterium haloterrestre TaxID=148448 RepID=A0A1I1LFI4_NATHA|nr:FlaD/FlaE family flagellar protein [Halobiforma haloterrestris]SFC71745.1 Flagella accessory protein C (FlaC) [Halobiforma haloterrestris]